MRAWLIAFVVVATAAALSPAHAQRKGESPQRKADPVENPAEKKAKDEAYKDALKRIPESKDKYDPWKIAR